MPTPRAATPHDLPALRTVCALAYRGNPLMRWVLPDETTRADACALWLGPSLERYLAGGRVDVVTVDDDLVALAAWRPAAAPSTSAAHLPTPAGALAALVGPARAAEVLGHLGGTADLAPTPGGPYLNYLAVHPAHQGRGLGGTLLRHGLAALAREDGTPWLATADERNVPFYERHGFTVAGSRRLGDGPLLRVMHAAARHASGTSPG
ncbi:GCN5-related N-acetyltransferase [Cellulomonas flavigena DSM 20109]|uniref:GCN5-related N-acetyltransferase n=1 Tax=Cellulomonas flavigena (strain ATCC 482 / DSM 20109 / BCRC 11376 / JCM 18109 / NBRC 3775 / NCIMB 8073 / NRS 134) TaxID=446466 RepID=D5UGU1_CELFN|nr:GNAT family N-acetyltransferase [Cellulomonas flavigena]ADG75189.1 GCN5-related N-acetyltransferase [Cellulomonas flavigena DSM 20109]